MARARRSGKRAEANIWPGFVDAMTAVLLVIMFVLSIFMIIQELALGVEVPGPHSAEVIDSTFGHGNRNTGGKPHVRILSGQEKPEDPYAAVRYRGYWFWIEHHDVQSKRAFSFIQLLMTYSESGENTAAPVLTLPTG